MCRSGGTVVPVRAPFVTPFTGREIKSNLNREKWGVVASSAQFKKEFYSSGFN